MSDRTPAELSCITVVPEQRVSSKAYNTTAPLQGSGLRWVRGGRVNKSTTARSKNHGGACERCRSAKVRCDGEGRCKRCAQNKQSCSLDDSSSQPQQATPAAMPSELPSSITTDASSTVGQLESRYASNEPIEVLEENVAGGSDAAMQLNLGAVAMAAPRVMAVTPPASTSDVASRGEDMAAWDAFDSVGSAIFQEPSVGAGDPPSTVALMPALPATLVRYFQTPSDDHSSLPSVGLILVDYWRRCPQFDAQSMRHYADTFWRLVHPQVAILQQADVDAHLQLVMDLWDRSGTDTSLSSNEDTQALEVKFQHLLAAIGTSCLVLLVVCIGRRGLAMEGRSPLPTTPVADGDMDGAELRRLTPSSMQDTTPSKFMWRNTPMERESYATTDLRIIRLLEWILPWLPIDPRQHSQILVLLAVYAGQQHQSSWQTQLMTDWRTFYFPDGHSTASLWKRPPNFVWALQLARLFQPVALTDSIRARLDLQARLDHLENAVANLQHSPQKSLVNLLTHVDTVLADWRRSNGIIWPPDITSKGDVAVACMHQEYDRLLARLKGGAVQFVGCGVGQVDVASLNRLNEHAAHAGEAAVRYLRGMPTVSSAMATINPIEDLHTSIFMLTLLLDMNNHSTLGPLLYRLSPGGTSARLISGPQELANVISVEIQRLQQHGHQVPLSLLMDLAKIGH